jgi:hypothetical protein
MHSTVGTLVSSLRVEKKRGCDLGHTSVCAAQFRFEQFQFGYFEELALVVESVDASAILVTCEAWSR